MACEALLVEQLKAHGMRLTPQREMVLEALHDLGHATVEETHRQVCLKSNAVDKSTVYRTLELLKELGLVVPVEIGDGALRYELALHGPHLHLRCESCGRTTTLGPSDLAPLMRRLKQTFGFVVGEHQVLHGLCAACAEQATRGKKT